MNQEGVRRLFDYDAGSGELTNRITRSNNALAGAKAGGPDGRGYLTVQVNKKPYKVHRVIWLWVHGYLPEHQIDHINRDRSDNRLENLREVSLSCNVKNSARRSSNTSGVTGVVWHKAARKWQAQIKVNNRTPYIGLYQDFTEAVKARHAAEIRYNWPGCNSSTDAYRYLKEISNGV